MRTRNILRIVVLVLCGTILGVNIYMLNAKTLVGEQMPMPFGYGAAVVLSGSMEPELSVGDLILVRETSDYEAGDVVVYQDVNCLVVHRVINMTDDEVITKGDANNVADKPVTKEAVKGKVVLQVPLIGYLVNFLKTGVGTVVTLIAAFLLIEIPRRREKEKDDAKRQAIIDEIERLRNEA